MTPPQIHVRWLLRRLRLRPCRLISLALLIQAMCAGWLSAAEPDAKGIAFFETHIRPLLVEKCQSCHSAENPESELALDSRAALLEGGTRGASIVPGKPNESLLLSALRHGELLKMPPKDKLPENQLARVAQWIEMGAPWPDSPTAPKPVARTKPAAGKAALEPEITAEQKAFWAFQSPARPSVPQSSPAMDSAHPIDRFIGDKLHSAGLTASNRAERYQLIRRATLDLWGLPPTAAEVTAFVADESPDAWPRLIDRLLASPRYGERWGRHWLDVARYGDSNGLDENLAFANAFRYRDYVISAFNRDLPFDRFVREQIAGDLLTDFADESQRQAALTATGFLALGAKMLAEDDPVKMRMDIIDEQLDTIGKAFLGLTLGCARCHDHKYDPISAADYYGLAGMLYSTRTMENYSVVARWQEKPLASADELKHRQQLQQELADVQRTKSDFVQTENRKLLDPERARLGEYLLAVEQLRLRERWLAGRPLQGPQLTATPLPGTILLQAEDFVRGNVQRDTTHYGREIGVLVNQGPTPNFVEYDLQIPAEGWYQIEIRVAAADARPCQLSFRGQLLTSDAAGKVTGGWFPEHQQWQLATVQRLPAGTHPLRLERAGPFPHIDQILLVPVALPAALQSVPGLTATNAASDVPGSAPDEKSAASDKSAANSVAPVWPALVQSLRTVLDKLPAEDKGPLSIWKLRSSRLQTLEIEKQSADLLTAWQELIELAREFQDASQPMKDRPAKEGNAGANSSLTSEQRNQLATLLTAIPGPFAPPADIEARYEAPAREKVAAWNAEIGRRESALPKFPEVMAVSDDQGSDLKVHIRGSHLTLGTLVPRRLPRIFTAGAPQPLTLAGSGRRELADWLTNPRHPLTARVMVNRVWQWHFGQGLVRSPDNFGRLGELPTHPELLDWLAVEFVESGWSLKQMHRLIMTSETYQQQSHRRAELMAVDPENRLWWHYPRRRLEAEAVRDSLLAISGQLDESPGGSLLPTPNRNYVTSTFSVNPQIYSSLRRSVYLPVVRSALYEVFQSFDFADPTTLNGQRQSTIVAAQALFLMNSEFSSQQAEAWARRLLALPVSTDEERIQAAYQQAFGRQPRQDELQRASRYLSAAIATESARQQTPATASGTPPAAKTPDVGDPTAAARRIAWRGFCRALFSSNEFLFLE